MDSEWIKSTIMDAEGQMHRAHNPKVLGKGKEALDLNTVSDLIDIAAQTVKLQLYADYVQSCLDYGLPIDSFFDFDQTMQRYVKVLKKSEGKE